MSIWLDDLSRTRLNSGDLARKIREDDVVGVTTNPAIFQAAISGAADYAAPIAELASSGASPEEVIKRLTTDDVREASVAVRATVLSTVWTRGPRWAFHFWAPSP